MQILREGFYNFVISRLPVDATLAVEAGYERAMPEQRRDRNRHRNIDRERTGSLIVKRARRTGKRHGRAEWCSGNLSSDRMDP